MNKRMELLKKSIEFIAVLIDLPTDDFYEVKYTMLLNVNSIRAFDYMATVFEIAEIKRPLLIEKKA